MYTPWWRSWSAEGIASVLEFDGGLAETLNPSTPSVIAWSLCRQEIALAPVAAHVTEVELPSCTTWLTGITSSAADTMYGERERERERER